MWEAGAGSANCAKRRRLCKHCQAVGGCLAQRQLGAGLARCASAPRAAAAAQPGSHKLLFRAPCFHPQEFPPFQPTADGSTECDFPEGEGAAGKQPPLTGGFADLPEDATEGTTDTATDEELLPYLARVFGPAANCSGVLIAPGYLLTSGWCMWRVRALGCGVCGLALACLGGKHCAQGAVKRGAWWSGHAPPSAPATRPPPPLHTSSFSLPLKLRCPGREGAPRAGHSGGGRPAHGCGRGPRARAR